MSNLSPFSRRGRTAPAIPHGDVLGTYETYLEAQTVIDRLSKADFEITGLAIVGNNLTSVEQVTGKLSYGRTAIAGAARGAWFGLFIGLMFFLFSPIPVIGYIAAATFIGAGISMVFSVAMYSLGRRTRDFTSTNHVLARSYDIVISPQLLMRARTILAQPQPQPQPQPQSESQSKVPAVPGSASDGATDRSRKGGLRKGWSRKGGSQVVGADTDVSNDAGSDGTASAEAGSGTTGAGRGDSAARVAAVARPAYGELAPLEPEAVSGNSEGEIATESTSGPAAESSVKEVVTATAAKTAPKPATKPAGKSTTSAAAVTVVEPIAKSSAKFPGESASKLTAEPGAKPRTRRAPKPPADPADSADSTDSADSADAAAKD